LIWRRIGEPERIFHKVIAASDKQAIAASEAEMRSTLGTHFDYWQLDICSAPGVGSL
jgi:hypothetical protein